MQPQWSCLLISVQRYTKSIFFLFFFFKLSFDKNCYTQKPRTLSPMHFIVLSVWKFPIWDKMETHISSFLLPTGDTSLAVYTLCPCHAFLSPSLSLSLSVCAALILCYIFLLIIIIHLNITFCPVESRLSYEMILCTLLPSIVVDVAMCPLNFVP